MSFARASRVYLTIGGVMSLANAIMFTTYAIYYVSALGLNPLQLVLVGTLLEATILLFEVPTGVVADTYSRRLSVIIGMFVLGTAYTLEGAVPWLLPGALVAGVMGAEVVRGLGWTFLSGALDAWVADEVGEERLGALYLRESQISQIASLIGMGLSVGLASLKLNLPFLVGGALHLVLGLFLLLFMRETAFTPAPREGRSTFGQMGETLRVGLRTVRGRPLLMMVLAVGLFRGISSEGFDRLWEAHLWGSFTLPGIGALEPVAWFGVIAVVGMLLRLATTTLVRNRLKTENPQMVTRYLLALTLFRIGLVVLFGLAGSFWLALAAFWVMGMAGSVGEPLYRTWLGQQVDPKVRATVLSFMGLTDAFGQTAGGPVVGAVGTRFSLRSAMVLTGALLAPAAAVYARATRQGAVDVPVASATAE